MVGTAEYLMGIVVLILVTNILSHRGGYSKGAVEMKEILQKPPEWTDILPKGVRCIWRGGPFRISPTMEAGVVEYPGQYSSKIATIETDKRIIDAKLESGDEFVITQDWQIIKNSNKNPT